MQAWNVKLGRKIIDKVFYDDNCDKEWVKACLINHDGYDAAIIVTKVRRKLKSEWELQSNFGSGHGWECVTTEETWKAVKEQIKCYRDNAPQYPYRIVHRRVPV